MSEDLIIGIDIGSTKIAATVARLQEEDVEIIGMARVPNYGLRRGQIIDVESSISALSALIETLEHNTQTPINRAIVGIGGVQSETTHSKGVIAVSRPDGEITPADVERVLDAARAVSIPANREIVHVVPQYFTIDNEKGIYDPVGLTGVRLEVETHIVSASSQIIKNLMRVLNQNDLEAEELVFNPMATAHAMLSRRQKESGAVLIDIGAGTTGLAIYEEGELVHAAILPIGGTNITNDIAIGLKTSIDVAEAVKLKFGTVDKTQLKDSDVIFLNEIDPQELDRPKLKYLTEIIEARLVELFMMVQDELGKVGKDGNLPAGAVLTGGSSQIPGILDMAKSQLRLPAKLAQPQHQFSGRVDKIDDPTYATSIGLTLWSLKGKKLSRESKNTLKFDNVEGVVGKAKEFLKNLLP